MNTLVLDETGHDTDALTGATIAVSYYVDAVKDALSK
ncbi:MAG: FMN-binding protein [Clostridia bacterium]|nr:FMN-binding protein [Clostridia bacterium]